MMESSASGGEIRIKSIRELGDILSLLSGIRPDVMDLPLSHLDTLSRAKAYAEKYGEVLKAHKYNKHAVIVAPFGIYRSVEDMLDFIQNSADMQELIESHYAPKRKEGILEELSNDAHIN